jgi:RNA polymerase sigma-70 factor (ECF subfamily)
MAMQAAEFRAVLEQHQRMVFSIALRIAGVYETAEEVAQDVFLELYRGEPRLESDDHLRFWLRRVAVHRATDALRKRQRQPEQTAEEWIEEQHSAPPANGNGMHAGMEARLETLLQTLNESQRVVVVLRYTEGMMPEEIAKLLGQPLATVKSNLQRGLALLRRKAQVTMKEYVREQA